MKVPVSVPSLFHSSRPFTASWATKYSTPPLAVRWPGMLLPVGWMSRTRCVPAAVPSVRHSSLSLRPVVSWMDVLV
jgi:hypothetical protein